MLLAEHTCSKEGKLILWNRQNFLIHEEAGHQGHDHTLSLLWEHFWWLEMTDQVQKSLKSCSHCLQHEGKLSMVPLHLIVSTAPMDLLHIDFTRIMMTMEPNRPPKVANVLVFQDHFTKHAMAYVTPTRPQRQLPSFCIGITSQSLEPQPGS